jgi:hypothetical protein
LGLTAAYAFCEPIVCKCGSLDVSQPYGFPPPITGVALHPPKNSLIYIAVTLFAYMMWAISFYSAQDSLSQNVVNANRSNKISLPEVLRTCVLKTEPCCTLDSYSGQCCDSHLPTLYTNMNYNLKVGCLHPVACTRSGSGFPSNATLV